MIVCIRGTSGSGKSFIAKQFIDNHNGKPIEGNLQGKAKKTIVAYRCTDEKFGVLYVIGRYETSCGGCDGIREMDDVENLVRKYAQIGHVLFEGLIVTSVTKRWVKISKNIEKYGRFIWSPMTTDIKDCIRNVKKRNKGKKFNIGNLTKKNDTHLRTIRTALAQEQVIIPIWGEHGYSQLLNIFRQVHRGNALLPKK